MKRMLTPLVSSVLLLSLSAPRLRASDRELATVESAGEVVRAFSDIPLRSIPPALLKEARGVVVIPNVVKAGFLVGGRFGRGVALTREPDGRWGNPGFVTITGGSFGFQAGVQSTDVVLVFMTSRSLDRVLRGGGKVTLGADVAIAVGPVGRQAEAATDGMLRAEIYSYSRSRGLFAGVSLEGAALLADTGGNAAFCGPMGPALAAAAETLKGNLARLSAPPAPLYLAPTLPPAPPMLVPAAPPPPPPLPPN